MCMMYLLSPVGYPIARLLDRLLGTYHDRSFSREGLKALIMLHEAPLYLPTSICTIQDRLHPLETSSICKLLSSTTTPVSEIMTPVKALFTLSANTYLNEMICCDILQSGFSKIPVYEERWSDKFVGMLSVRLLIGTGFQQQDARVGEVELEALRTLAPGTTLTEALGIFKNREAKMVVITEGGRNDGHVLGILTFRDVIEAAIGREMEMR